jgi:hypothetical protein
MKLLLLPAMVAAMIAFVGASATATAKVQRTSVTCPPGTSNPSYCTLAPGEYCKGLTKEHVEGLTGTPFSLCVTAIAKLAKSSTLTVSAACKGEPKTRVNGMSRTPFAACVSAGKLFRKDQNGS